MEHTPATPETQVINFKDWAAWLPVATALIYFYDWVFEYVTCSKLNIPASLIEPTIGSILFFAGVLIFFVAAGGLFLGSIYLIVKNAKFWYVAIAAIGLLALTNAVFFINNWYWSISDGIRMSILAGYCWLFLFIYWILIKVFAKYDTWEKIFNYMLVDGSNELKEFPKLVKRYRVIGFSIVLLFFTWLSALAYVGLNPPDLQILEKEKLVIVKKYGDVVICRYLDSANNHLNDSIRVIKLDGSTGLLTKTISPAPSH